MKHDLEALDKGYDSLNYFYCTYVRILNLEALPSSQILRMLLQIKL